MKTYFKIQGIGLDTTNLGFPLQPGDEYYNYIMTDLNSNNDYLLGEYLKKNGSSLIVKTNYLDSVELTLKDHLFEVGREWIDLLLIKGDADWSKAEKMNFVKAWGISHPTTTEEIIKADSVLKEKDLKLEYILISACPLDYDLAVMEKAKELGLTVLIDNPMGGYLSAPRNIETFSAPYLLCFAANQGDVVFLSSRDLVRAGEGKEYLSALIGKESSPMFELNKTIQKPVKSIKKVVYTSSKVSNEVIIPYESPDLLTTTENTVFTLGRWKEVLPPEEEVGEDTVVGKVKHLIGITHIPEDAKDRITKFTHLRYRVGNYLLGTLGEEYELEYSFTDTTMLITATKPFWSTGILWWYHSSPEIKRYFVFLLSQEGNPIFYEINAPVEGENP